MVSGECQRQLMSRWSVFSSADDALVRVGKQAGMVTISPVDWMSFSVFRVKLCGKWCWGGVVHPFFRSAWKNNVVGILIWEEIYILIIWFIILDPRQDLLVTDLLLFVVASSMPGTVNTYIYVTTFKYVEGGPDREAREVVWNTSSYI